MEQYDLTDFSLQKQFEFHKICKLIDEIENIEESKKVAKDFLHLYMNTQTAISKLAVWDINKS